MNIELSHIYKTFGDKKVLTDFSQEINEHTCTAIMGQSGCGKTTLASIICGLLKADKGEIKGTDNKKFSMVFQENRLCENLSAVSNIQLVLPRLKDNKVITDMLSSLLLDTSISQPVKELSGGMKRRVALARALCADYDILVLDEPFKGLDEETKEKVIDTVKKSTAGKTVILITHDESEAEALNAEIINLEI